MLREPSCRLGTGNQEVQYSPPLNIPIIADLHSIRARRQHLIDERLRVANLKRRSFDYQVNQEVLQLLPSPDKLAPRAIGPFRIVQVHTKGTVTIRRNPFVTERINIRRLKPYRRA